MEGQNSEVRSQKSESEIQHSAFSIQHSEENPNPQSPIPLLDLSVAERTVALTVGRGQRFIHHFRPPKAEEWLEYERAVKPTLIFREDEVETRAATRSASDALWQKLILRLEGYDSDVQCSSFSIQKVPLEHRVKAVTGLDQVQAAADQDVLGDSETAVVKLEAWWNGVFFPALIHRFKRPLVEHELRFREALERRAIVTRRIGGQKRPKNQALESRSLPVLPTLVALYDELIVGVEGYLIPNPQSPIPVFMDVPHKSAAVRALFAAEAVELEEFPSEEKDA